LDCDTGGDFHNGKAVIPERLIVHRVHPAKSPRGDAGNYITKLPKAEHTAPESQDAMQALMLVARGGLTMLAMIGVMRAFNRLCSRGPSVAFERRYFGLSQVYCWGRI
jgi:hypothetical protein